MLGANIRAAQRYQASGVATEQAELPEQFHATPQPSSPISDHLDTPTDFMSLYPGQPNALVCRWPRMNGMRYLYAMGHIRMPVPKLGANCVPRPVISAYQPNMHGIIHNAGFYDNYFETGTLPNGIGWPGRGNLGLSYKVPTSEKNTAATGPISTSARMTGPRSARPQSARTEKLKRATVPGGQA